MFGLTDYPRACCLRAKVGRMALAVRLVKFRCPCPQATCGLACLEVSAQALGLDLRLARPFALGGAGQRHPRGAAWRQTIFAGFRSKRPASP